MDLKKIIAEKQFNMDFKGDSVIKQEPSYPGTSKLMISE